jgi:hypothetical protein
MPRFPMSREVVFESSLAEQAWLDGIRKECAKKTFLPPQFVVEGADFFLFLPSIVGGIQSGFFGTVTTGYTIMVALTAVVAEFLSFVVGWGEVSKMRAGVHLWIEGDVLINATLPLTAAVAIFSFWKASVAFDSENQKKLSQLIEAGAKV